MISQVLKHCIDVQCGLDHKNCLGAICTEELVCPFFMLIFARYFVRTVKEKYTYIYLCGIILCKSSYEREYMIQTDTMLLLLLLIPV